MEKTDNPLVPGSLYDINFLLLVGILFMFTMAILIILFVLRYQTRLYRAKQEKIQMEKDWQKDLIHAGILAQEQDRQRMANDLHDGMGGTLSAIKMMVSQLHPSMPEDRFDRFKQKTIQGIEDNIVELRRIISDLLPKQLEDKGLIAAVRVLGKKVETIKPIRVKVTTNQEVRLEENREKAVFRILQELFNNAVKHSDAQQIEARFVFDESRLHIKYCEDGSGFSPELVQREGRETSFGLKSIASRMSFLDGQYEFNTAQGKGLTVHLYIPLSKPNDANHA